MDSKFYHFHEREGFARNHYNKIEWNQLFMVPRHVRTDLLEPLIVIQFYLWFHSQLMAKKPTANIPDKEADMPATRVLVREVRDELKADIRSLEHKMESRSKETDAKLEKMMAAIHRTQSLMEDQRGDNKAVMDGIKNVIDHLKSTDARVDEMERTIKFLARSKSPTS